MNIFVLDENPVKAARWLCNSHCVKMILETTQLLSTTHWAVGGKGPYRPTHINHKCSTWTRVSIQNYRWLVIHGLALCDEYTARYNRVHKCQAILVWLFNNEPQLPIIDLTPFAVAIKKDLWDRCYVKGDPVATYRNYYRLDKAKFATWKRNKPAWF